MEGSPTYLSSSLKEEVIEEAGIAGSMEDRQSVFHGVHCNANYLFGVSWPTNVAATSRTLLTCKHNQLLEHTVSTDFIIYVYSGEVRSEHKWSIKPNARCELTGFELSTCDRVTQD